MQEQQGTVDLIGQVTLFGNFSPLPNSFHNNKISSSDRYSDLQIHTAMDMSSKHFQFTNTGLITFTTEAAGTVKRASTNAAFY